MKAYITKYALTKGIYPVDGVQDGDTLIVGGKIRDYFHGSDWHLDWDSAKKRAELMRQVAIRSAKRKIDKLEAMEFVEPLP